LVEAANDAVGFTVKSGWASAVLMTGSATAVHLVDARRVDLSNPQLPESRQPYHAGTGTARPDGPELSRLVTSVESFGKQSVTEAIDSYQHAGYRLRGLGVVVGSLIDPNGIANAHIRIHALEGRLFRRVVEEAAAERHLPCSTWRERDLYGVAARVLRQQESHLRRVLKACGETTGGPWRAEQKAAALAAWLVLADPEDGGRGRRSENQKPNP